MPDKEKLLRYLALEAQYQQIQQELTELGQDLSRQIDDDGIVFEHDGKTFVVEPQDVEIVDDALVRAPLFVRQLTTIK